MQAGIAERFPAWLAVAGAGLLFGAMHWLTLSYAVLAGLVGMYLGAVFLLSGNLLVPIVAHGLYDVVALSILARRHAGSNAVPPTG
jgi:membrane protease YdiL (CAAX protease family)